MRYLDKPFMMEGKYDIEERISNCDPRSQADEERQEERNLFHSC
jgi:hypothetical protein